ncbi:phenylalanine 4-monooxygenase [Hymenobacter siberiensis]|uniref:phenylalanine 4-monooxygenase n=1 Tax=Hymenobacter siberiensis TaxID=2848396 RepID=UPI001C1E2C68|nr:phenylalanine 4-monooxygenase [Hymenobacter siberiensis]MBU6123431.1 phenylalanine 4-monooxygenase [Hymenobacter siberiensis]
MHLDSPAPAFTALPQDYARYTADDQWVWRILFERQMQVLPTAASRRFLEGLPRIHFQAGCIPDFAATNPLLEQATGWNLVAVPGIVDDRTFFALLAVRRFPATTWLRTPAQLDYLEEPDMFHDVFAHVPLLTDPFFADFLQAVGILALRHLHDPYAVELLSRLYWFTVEFGLITEAGTLRIYGAGILSSAGETRYCLSDGTARRPFDVAHILATPYVKDRMQDVYFVIDSYEQLVASVPALEAELLRLLAAQSAELTQARA